MEYIERLWKIILKVLCFFARITLRILLLIMVCILVLLILVTFPILLVLSGVEFLTVKPIYYIVTGKKYTEKYNTLLDMFGDLMFFGTISLKKVTYSKYVETDWYKEKWESIDNIDIDLYPKKEEE